MVIHPDSSILCRIQTQLISYIDTEVQIIIHFEPDCISPDTIVILIKASFSNPSNTGHNFDSVLIGQNIPDSITAENIGTVPLRLDQIDILDQKKQFAFENRTQTLDVHSTFQPFEKQNYHVVFTPEIFGPDTVTIRSTWDSAGVKKLYSTNLLIGYGIPSNRISEDRYLNISSKVKILKSGEKQIAVIFNNIILPNVKISIVSLLGVEIASWHGALDVACEKTFSVQASGPYYVIIESDGRKLVSKILL
jgi:hypothetical protein